MSEALCLASAVLALQVHQFLQDLVGGGDDAGVGLEAALGDDQVGELLGQVHVRHFQGPGGDGSEASRSRSAENGSSGVRGDPVFGVAVLFQAPGVGW